MKKILFIVLILCLVQSVFAANVGVITRFKDSTEQQRCVFVNNGGTAKNALDATDLNLEWSGSGSMAYLTSVNGILPDYANNEGWSFWHQNFNGDAFEVSSVGFGGYTVSSTGTVIGLSYSAYDPDTYLFLTPPTYTSYEEICERLSIEEVTAYIDGEKEKLSEGEKIKNVKPGSELELKIEVKNLYEEDIEIKDIRITATIKGIDDDDDLKEESDDFDLDAGKRETETLKFEIPLEVEDKEYDLILEVEGKDERGIEYKKTLEYSVDVEKEKHNVVIKKAELANSILKCQKTTLLDVNVINMGTEKEDVTLNVINNNLGVNEKVNFELSDDPFDKDSKYSTVFTIKINDVKAGTYPITVRADYSSKTTEKIVNLEVEDCKETKNIETNTKQNTKLQTSQPPATEKTTEIKNNNISYGFILIIALGLIVVIIFGGLLIAKLFF